MAFKKKQKQEPAEEKEQKPYFIDETTGFDTMKKKAGFTVGQVILSIVLGFIAGFVVWGAFVGSMVLTDLLWIDGVGCV